MHCRLGALAKEHGRTESSAKKDRDSMIFKDPDKSIDSTAELGWILIYTKMLYSTKKNCLEKKLN